jgi:hypothetical protein
MILQRITHAIRTQNWFAVVLEFVIVIAGVVIGFQVTGWADERARLARSDQMTQRLLDDLEDERWRLTASIRYLEDVGAEAGLALDAIEERAALSDEQLVIRTFRGTQFFGATANRTTYDELLNRAELDLIANNGLRARVAELYTTDPRLVLVDIEESELRRYFRRHTPPSLHAALARACQEDVAIETGDYASLENILAFPCSIEGHDAEIAELAARIRNDETFREVLRLVVIDADQTIAGVEYYWDSLHSALALGGRPVP